MIHVLKLCKEVHWHGQNMNLFLRIYSFIYHMQGMVYICMKWEYTSKDICFNNSKWNSASDWLLPWYKSKYNETALLNVWCLLHRQILGSIYLPIYKLVTVYIYYLLYNYVHLYTHSNHSNTQTQRRKLRVWAGGLNRTQKTPLDMERIFRSNWCFYHGWHESFYFDEKRKYIQWKQTQQKTPMEFKVW